MKLLSLISRTHPGLCLIYGARNRAIVLHVLHSVLMCILLFCMCDTLSSSVMHDMVSSRFELYIDYVDGSLLFCSSSDVCCSLSSAESSWSVDVLGAFVMVTGSGLLACCSIVTSLRSDCSSSVIFCSYSNITDSIVGCLFDIRFLVLYSLCNTCPPSILKTF